MRRRVRLGRLRTVVARALAIAGAAIVLTCGSLFLLAGTATPAVAGCGDQVTYQAGMAAGGCPRRAVGAVVLGLFGVGLGIGLAVLARAIQRSAASVGDLAAVDEALAAVELEAESLGGPVASAGVPESAELALQHEMAEELEAAGEGENKWIEDSFDEAPEVVEPIAEGGIEAGKTEENNPGPAHVASTGQVAMTSVSWAPPVYTEADPGIFNPIRDITVFAAAVRVGVRALKDRRGG